MAVLKTLDEKWSSPVAEGMLAPWEHEPGSSRIIRASSNFVFHSSSWGIGAYYFLWQPVNGR